MLLKDHFINPRIVDKYREIYFKAAFTAIANRFIDPEVRGFMYKLTHDTLYQLMRFHSHEWHYQPQGTCSHTDLYKNLNIWHLVNQIHPETPWQFGVLCVQC